ncbi:MAG: hypothetical protein ACRDFX_06425 [Chloroflexota bacterium]
MGEDQSETQHKEGANRRDPRFLVTEIQYRMGADQEPGTETGEPESG